MPSFRVTGQNRAWIDTAPIIQKDVFDLAVSAPQVFDRLADLGGWSQWYGGMKKVRIDGPDTGVGAMRTVWVGATRVGERFIEWEPGARLTFAIISSNLPGIGSMVEDWAVAPADGDATRSRLTVTIGVAPSGLLRPLAGVLKSVIHRSTRGSAGIVKEFS